MNMAYRKQQLALLKNELQIPLIVRDYLITDQRPDSTANYALHEMMSDFLPNDAILAAAFVMKEIADSQMVTSADLKYLHMECDRIIEKYSSNHINTMKSIFEDMEEFLDIISLCQMSFEIINSKINNIINILNIQMQSHLMIIDEVISMQKNVTPTPHLTNQTTENNIVTFPKP